MARNFTKKKVLKAIENSNANVTKIAKALGCDWHTADNYIHKWPETIGAFNDELEKINDIAESQAITLIKQNDAGMIKWWLSKKAKNRGFGDEVNATLSTGEDNTIKIIIDEPEPAEK